MMELGDCWKWYPHWSTPWEYPKKILTVELSYQNRVDEITRGSSNFRILNNKRTIILTILTTKQIYSINVMLKFHLIYLLPYIYTCPDFFRIYLARSIPRNPRKVCFPSQTKSPPIFNFCKWFDPLFWNWFLDN